MKWQPVKRSNLFILTTLIVLVVVASVYLFRSSHMELKPGGNATLQFGFYDLMLDQKEIYDSSMKTAGNRIMSNITSPDEKKFVLKGDFTQSRQVGNRHYFTYTPIYFMPSEHSRMLGGNVDLLVNSEFWMRQYTLDGVQLVMMQNGMIYLYPLEDK